ncbi:bifunctional GNAT family N-acetyltransferase/acetate--CoA ligase family protein [Acidiferrimicrobium sp. IK]|uniref:bifunctional acetate--CoA ligase family protein/GNAT family N-acetyltransferase n=1 Tax=Acidiferrimicrobium sp. IK TaxID=2871700 RepID=UPI0021CB0875|nr:bifunctional GNAT family N-acetyltransferase/acetate--CoA ligase family protein [Acidiferrimicrobium sp. IK]MCU4183662.1 bifunctional GNAT family N-acetyltransferase/acetate--CoA ligase family protein [Acidiferrimicrobium sp. IK]
MSEPPGYPAQWEADVVLSDGSTMHVRPIRPDDAPRIEALHASLSPETIYFRFFTPVARLSPKMLERFTVVDYTDRLALVGVLGGKLIAVARYETLPAPFDGGKEAEVAFLVSDEHQGRGIASLLLEHLAAAGRVNGITRFVADTLPENSRMLRVFHDAGFDDVRTFADGVVRVAFPIEPTETSLAAASARGQRAASRSVARLLSPTSVAVIGASTKAGTLGHVLLRSVLAADFNGPVYAVHPTATHVAAVPAYRSVLDVPDRIDLAVIIAPAEAVPQIAAECVRKHVAGLVVISSGFAESDAVGAEAQRLLVSEVRGNGLRLIGPNCMGALNTDPAVRLNATFSPMPPAGQIGFVAGSGALGVVILDEVRRRGLGVSSFVSIGNRADVSGNDLLQYWDDDPRTEVVCMYLETFGNPRSFARVARRLSARKPIVAVKSGRSPAGVRAAGSHRRAEGDLQVDALFRQSGVIRTDTLEELFDVTQVLSSQPLPAGNRVAIVGNNGGPGVVAADACDAAGLDVVALASSTLERLRALLPSRSPVGNPLGLPPDAQPHDFEAAITAVLTDPGIDSVIALYTSPLAAPLEDVNRAIGTASATAPDKPVLACVLGRRGLLETAPGGRRVPSFAFPEAAARALGAVAAYSTWRIAGQGEVPELDGVDAERGRAVVEAALASADGSGASPTGAWLDHGPTRSLLDAYGIARLDSRVAGDVDAAVAAAVGLGFPVVVRADPHPDAPAGERTHLRVGLSDPDAVRAAWDAIGDPSRHVTVQRMARPGLDVVVGVAQDPTFGSLVTLARSAGTGVPPRRRAARSVPLTDIDIAGLVDEVADGWSDLERTLIGLVLARVARMAEDLPEIVELDINPLIVGPSGALAAGGQVRVAPWVPRPELALRRLV